MTYKEDLLKYLGIETTSNQDNQFEIYYQFLIEYNKITNLTRIIDKDEVYYKHFFDSLTLVKSIEFNNITSICDMGSGTGFPSLPLKIIYPHLKVTIVDSLNKRILFLKQLIDKLKLSEVTLIHDRAEHFALSKQSSFDIVTARALGSISLITEMGLPMTNIGGKFIALKGLNYEDEFHAAKQGIHILGGEVEEIKKYVLPNQYGTRFHILIKKNKHVKGYPRHFSVMSKKPL
ncbi:MAG: 16S rRNA (guanine(527)-N(7))-methyltransferase RsmG [Firmicutes bacterium]|nr:16S rRNA (guanine(527)-N(7))-methyltransferase RsmG [Bacillota bacterium]